MPVNNPSTRNTQQVAVRELDFGQRAILPDSPYRRAMVRACAVALAVHAIALLVLIGAQRFHAVRVGPEAPPREGISAFVFSVPQPTGTSGMKPVVKKPEPVRNTPAPAPDATRDAATREDMPAAVAEPGAGVSTGSSQPQGGAPLRLGAGDNVRLLKKVESELPPAMESARIEGVVVLDAVIHREGTIGNITVLQSTNPAFEQAAIAAVKQWRYTPIPHEGVVTVTLNFTVPR